MKYHEMTKNYIFREFECGLTREETAKLCFKSLRAVTELDRGKCIPPECKRLMRLMKGKELATSEVWKGFLMKGEKLELPTGQLVTPQEILLGIALIEIRSDVEVTTCNQLLKFVRCIANIKNCEL